MAAPKLRFVEIEAFERPTAMRLPFRFGATTVETAPQAFVRVRIADESGHEAVGAAAEMMVPKWFDKNPALSPGQSIEQLRRSLHMAIGESLADAAPASLFAMAQRNERETFQALGENRLVAGFGPALIARAALDAWCRMAGVAFQEAIRHNLVGMEGPDLPDDITDREAYAVLFALQPSSSIAARHTVGLLDPITEAQVVRPQDDGLPESLEAVITRYGNKWFKIKLCGDLDADLDRLERIASVTWRVPGYRTTLDGNEQFENPEAVEALLARIAESTWLQRLRHSIAYFEQPLPRDTTLQRPLGRLAETVPFLIDESDDHDEAYGRARELGYTGVSSKTCKGVYRSLLKAIRIRLAGDPRRFLSGEDLTCQAGLSVQQDLALVGLLGLDHVERNGHHYVDGMQGAPPQEMDRFAAAHPDLYRRSERGLHLVMEDGRLVLDSLSMPGFASGVLPDFDAMSALADCPQKEEHHAWGP